jgi:acetylornithine/succinyldiaminopimelate/putrescine aminotransferase
LKLNELDKKDLEEKGLILSIGLKQIQSLSSKIKAVNATGLLGAIITEDTNTATQICKLAEERNLLVVYTSRNSVKLGPPLIISHSDLLKGIEILKECVKELK